MVHAEAAASYEYTGRNEVKKITENGITWVEYLYDLSGNRRERRLFNNLMRTAYGAADANNRIPSFCHTFTGGDTARFGYGYDDVNRLRYEQRDSAKADGYAYGKADQVVGFNREGTLQAQWHGDERGRRDGAQLRRQRQPHECGKRWGHDCLHDE